MFAQATLKLAGPMDHLRLVWQTGETLLGGVSFDVDAEGTRYNVLLALQEMVTNVLRHAYGDRESQPLEVSFAVSADQLKIELRDQGPAFDPLAFDAMRGEQSTSGDAGVPTEVGGFGITIARSVMDEVEYAREGDWNCLRMTKWVRLTAATGSAR